MEQQPKAQPHPKPSIVFFGSGPVALSSLKFILEHFIVEAVVTKPATQHEMNQLVDNLPVYSVQNSAQLDELIGKSQLKSKLGILVDFGIIVSKKVIDHFPLGIINSHFSLLPKLRGSDPIAFAILEGYEKTGVSLMLIDENIDTGKLIGQKTLRITPNDTTPSLTNKLISLSNSMLADYVPRYLTGEIKPRNQPHPSRATYTHKLTKTDGVIDWNKPAQQIEREIRAFAGWPGSRTTLADRDVIITAAHAVPSTVPEVPGHVKIQHETGTIMVNTVDGYLSIEHLKPAGKNDMTASEFIRGYIR